MLAVLRCCGFLLFVLRSGQFVGHVFVNLDLLIHVCLFCYLKTHFSFRVCVSMLDCFLAIMLVWKATLDLPVSSIDLVSVDLPSKFVMD